MQEAMSNQHKKKNDFEQRLLKDKASIRERFSWMPFMDWFKRDENPKAVPPADELKLERGDVLAMILAVLSLVLPWLLAIAAGLGGLIALMQWVFR